MRIFWIAMLLLGTLAWSQSKPVAPNSPSDKARSASADADDDEKEKPSSAAHTSANVTDSTPVLTIEGLCNQPSTKPAVKAGAASAHPPCRTIVTRAQFEKLVMAIMPATSPQSKQQFANNYPRLLVMAREAQARGLDKSARFEQILAYARLQILSQELVRDFREDAAKVTEKDIADYYRQNAAAFERVSLDRVFVPLRKQMQAPISRAEEKPAEEEMQKVAEGLHARAMAGEDFATLQKDAYEAAGMKGAVPVALLEKMRRNQLPPAHASVFDMKPGQISDVIKDNGGYYVYKLNVRDQEPEQEAAGEIRSTLEQQRFHDMMDKMNHSYTTESNQAYFGAAKMPSAGDED